ncbi:MAG: hypothetical protein ACTSQY_01005 [Candidatus Odinarchaeia archaeon]
MTVEEKINVWSELGFLSIKNAGVFPVSAIDGTAETITLIGDYYSTFKSVSTVQCKNSAEADNNGTDLTLTAVSYNSGNTLLTSSADLKTDSGGCDVEIASWTDFHFKTESISISLPEKGASSIHNVAGWTLWKFDPLSEATITVEAYPLTLVEDEKSMMQYVFGSEDIAQDIYYDEFVFHRRHQEFDVLVLFTSDTTFYGGSKGADEATAQDEAAFRYIFRRCVMTKCDVDYGDKVMKVTFEFKCKPYTKDGKFNIICQSIDYNGNDANAHLPAINLSALHAFDTNNIDNNSW